MTVTGMLGKGDARTLLHWAAWCAWIVGVILLTTTPWSEFQGHAHWSLVQWVPFGEGSVGSPRFQADLVGNMILFVPFGFLYAGARSVGGRRCLVEAVLFSFILSASVELLQVYMHNRSPSVTDITMNVTGALAGVLAWLKVSAWRTKG